MKLANVIKKIKTMTAINKSKFAPFKKNIEIITASKLIIIMILNKGLPDLSSSFVKSASNNPRG